MKRILLTACCFNALAFAALPASAWAADEAEQQAAPAAVAEDSVPAEGLADIIVTAQRKSENLQRAPIAITAVSGDALRNAGVTRPNELTSVVPSLQVVTSAGPYSLFYLRGVGNFNGNALSDSAVAFNYNGVYIGRPSSTTGYFYDLDRIEVLKGPQGTLYGRNATGGAINVIPHAPELGEFSGSLTGEYGNYDAVRVDGAINVPLGDNAAVRAAGIFVRHDGYMSDGSDGQNDGGGRLTLLWKPTDTIKLTISGDYFHQGGSGPGSTPIAIGVDNRFGLTSPEAEAYYQTQRVSVSGRNFNGVTTQPYLNNDFYGVSATLDWTLPFGTITLIPAYRGAKVDFTTSTPGFQIKQRERDNQFSFEARLASNDDHALRYLFGMFYYDESNDVPLYSVNSQYNASYQNYRATTRSMAVFGRLTYALTDTFRVTAGARYTTEDKTFAGSYLSMSLLCVDLPAFQNLGAVQVTGPCPGAAAVPYSLTSPPSAGTPFNPAFPYTGLNEIYGPTAIFQAANQITPDKRASFEKLNYRLAVDWDVTPDNLLYASYETGFKSGGFFFSADEGVFRPETIKALTIGSKNRFMSNRLQMNLEAFWWKYKDQQISHLSQDSARNVIFGTENAGNATFKGVEAEVRFLATPNTLLSMDVQYLDAKYDNFVYNVPNQGPPLTGCNQVGVPTSVITLDCSGFRPPNAPKWTINLGAQQTIPLANGGKFVLNGRAHYQSDTLTGLEFLPAEMQPSYWMLDAAVTYAAPDDRFFVTGFVNNATNTTVIANTFPPPLATFVVGSLRPPRTYGVRAGVRF